MNIQYVCFDILKELTRRNREIAGQGHIAFASAKKLIQTFLYLHLFSRGFSSFQLGVSQSIPQLLL